MLSRRMMGGAAGLALAMAATAAPAAAQGSPVETTFDRIRRTKKLRSAAVVGGAPYYHKDLATGQWRGFYVDLLRMLAEELECELELGETTWGNAVLDLQSNKIDIFFGLNPTPKRALVVDFSVPCFSNAFSFVTKRGFQARTWDDLNRPEVKIAVDTGSSQDQVVTRLCPRASVSRFKSADEATMAVQSGRADAQCLVLILALTAKKKLPTLGDVLVPTPVFATTSNAGFRREADKTWRDYVNTWIEFNKGLGAVRSAIVSNMELVGISEADFPPGVTL
ncbi:transporter substrate-binding domain-containing protein [Roseomonas sp. KE0001]|uniref:transporter substrate-binding domain-containing protein n=1 Tax=Roseomonas sp. KE0001 TaxID=2479201 RepID=UPI001E3E37D5|nr:transporter substrate-binding domain-containing protein [Roseomonas sp. KE0001]MBI0432703.1 ABC transporter substrate-binding protein [Roseomonas sp. KE0001]